MMKDAAPAWFGELPDMSGWRLNPAFSLWLQGYPAEWLWHAPHSAPIPRKKKRGG
jgi:hypothetical protein